MAKLPEELAARVERLATSEGLELLAIEVGGTARQPAVRLVLDRESGVSLADCERVSRQASVLLDAYDPFPGPFTLEVTSPGLERKLYADKDFIRFAGKLVKVRMRPTWQGEKSLLGILRGRSGGVVTIADADDVELCLPEGEVFEVRLAPFETLRRRKPRGRNAQ